MANLKITGGILVPYGAVKPTAFTIHSRDLTASPDSNGWDAGLPVVGKIYQAGQNITFSGQISGDQSLKSGPAVYRGKYYAKLWYTGSFQFASTPVPCPADSNKAISVRTKFVLTGSFSGYPDNSLGDNAPAVFTYSSIEGKGLASVQLGASYVDGANTIRDQILIAYAFR